ncbi:hypothetical protein AX14_013848 [Amanita brunnescens Koide BX004]|nr:hypothetical protein AX14_013848 [Amanita brunnescens Koide BX004]
MDANKDSPGKKKSTARSKKNAPITGVWPCKINGCNKEFAREADLKRHQRTTRLHAMPNFSCPQCEATFTRPDALRRHQKSRHNGVVIEPKRDNKDEDEDADDPRSSARSRSSSATPSSKGKERVDTGHMKYYRSHTATSSSYIPSRPVMNPQYDQVALPTSATRLNSSPNWSYSHPWPEHNLPPIGYSHAPMYYTPSPHYRIDGPPPMLHPVSQISASRSQSNSHESSSRTTLSNHSSTSYTSSERTTTEQGDNSTASSPSTSSCVHMIDPSLESKEVAHTGNLTEEQVQAISIEITQAAMKAVLESAKQEAEARASRKGDENEDTKTKHMLHGNVSRSNALHPLRPTLSGLAKDQDVNASQELQSHVSSGVHMSSAAEEVRPPMDTDMGGINDYGASIQPPRSVEQSQLLDTDEDGMLSPEEWLTQESLASSPS